MTLLFHDGFDQYDAAADLSSFGGWTSSGNTVTANARVGGGKTLRINGSQTSVYNFAADQAGKTLYYGFAYMCEGNAGTSNILQIKDSGGVQCTLRLNSTSSKLELFTSSIVSSGSAVLSLDTWYYIEVKALVGNAGTFEVRVNESVDLSYSGDTQVRTTNSVTNLLFTAASVGSLFYIDDFYVLNSDGSVNNGYLGEQLSEIMAPNADSSIAWSRNTGASNYGAVDDAVGAPDEDTVYVYSSTVGAKDEYGLSDLSGVNNVAGVKLITRAQKDDANPLSLKTGIKSGSTDQQVTRALGVGYANFIDIFETSDGAGTAFTSTTVNSLLSTIEVAA